MKFLNKEDNIFSLTSMLVLIATPIAKSTLCNGIMCKLYVLAAAYPHARAIDRPPSRLWQRPAYTFMFMLCICNAPRWILLTFAPAISPRLPTVSKPLPLRCNILLTYCWHPYPRARSRDPGPISCRTPLFAWSAFSRRWSQGRLTGPFFTCGL